MQSQRMRAAENIAISRNCFFSFVSDLFLGKVIKAFVGRNVCGPFNEMIVLIYVSLSSLIVYFDPEFWSVLNFSTRSFFYSILRSRSSYSTMHEIILFYAAILSKIM